MPDSISASGMLGVATDVRGSRWLLSVSGTGCTLSSAIAANLAKGFDLSASIQRSKAYLSGALEAMLDLGQPVSPLCLLRKFAGQIEVMPHGSPAMAQVQHGLQRAGEIRFRPLGPA